MNMLFTTVQADWNVSRAVVKAFVLRLGPFACIMYHGLSKEKAWGHSRACEDQPENANSFICRRHLP